MDTGDLQDSASKAAAAFNRVSGEPAIAKHDVRRRPSSAHGGIDDAAAGTAAAGSQDRIADILSGREATNAARYALGGSSSVKEVFAPRPIDAPLPKTFPASGTPGERDFRQLALANLTRAGVGRQAAKPILYGGHIPVGVSTTADLGNLVRSTRKRLKLNQQDFADLAGVGRRFVSELEAGKATLEIGKVLACCAAAGVDILAYVRSEQ